MKKVLIVLLVLSVALFGAVSFSACNKDIELVVIDAEDLLQEDFGIAVKKGNTTLLNAVNAVINEWNANGKMAQYLDYYDAVASEQPGDSATAVPEGLTVEWDFGDATETITVYTESGFAPYEFMYDNEVIGLDIALMSQVAVNLGKKIEIEDVIFDTIPTLVSTAQGDAVGAAGMTITEDRAAIVDFSEVYSSSTLVIVSAKGIGYNSVEALAGKKVGVQEGTSGDLIISAAIEANGYSYSYTNDDEEEIEVNVKATGAQVSRYKQYSLVLADLKNGRIDAILMDKIPALLLVKSQG